MALQTPYAHLVPPLSDADRRALEADLRDGQDTPIIVDELGNVLDGHNRYEILGDTAKTRVVSGLSEAEKKALVFRRATGRRNLTPEQRRELHELMKNVAVELRRENPQRNTQKRIADKLGVTQQCVQKWLADGGMTTGCSVAAVPPGFQPKYPPEVRSEAVTRVLTGGETVTAVASTMRLPRKTVSDWCSADAAKAVAADAPPKEPETPREMALALLRNGETVTAVAEAVGARVSTVSNWRRKAGIETSRAAPKPKPEIVERRMQVLELHNDGLGSAEIARRLGLETNQVSKQKVALGIAESVPGVKLWGDVDRVATLLEGTEIQLAELVARLDGAELTADPKEISRCISSLSRSRRTVSLLINALKQRRQ